MYFLLWEWLIYAVVMCSSKSSSILSIYLILLFYFIYFIFWGNIMREGKVCYHGGRAVHYAVCQIAVLPKCLLQTDYLGTAFRVSFINKYSFTNKFWYLEFCQLYCSVIPFCHNCYFTCILTPPFFFFPDNIWQDGIFKMNLSPDGTLLAAIHFSGKLTIWSIPSLRQQGEWDQTDQV